MSKLPEFLIDTDIIANHFTKPKEEGNSDLVNLMQLGMCFTTVLNASELMLSAKSEEDKFNIKSVLSALKVLGLNARYSLYVNHGKDIKLSSRDALFLVVAELNKLNIVAYTPEKYYSDKIKIFHPDLLFKRKSHI